MSDESSPALPCLARVVSRTDRQLIRLHCRTPLQIRQKLSAQLSVDPSLLVVVHLGEVLCDDVDLMTLMNLDNNELQLMVFVLDAKSVMRASASSRFESVMSSPTNNSHQSVGHIVYEIPVDDALEFLGRYYFGLSRTVLLIAYSNVSSALREPLIAMGFPESRAVKALLLNGLDVERAMEWLLDHAEDEDVDASLTPLQISQLVSSLVASQG
jgi:hypothetical protein